MSKFFRDEAEIFRILKRLLQFYVKNYAINSATAVVRALRQMLRNFEEGTSRGRAIAPLCGRHGGGAHAKWSVVCGHNFNCQRRISEVLSSPGFLRRTAFLRRTNISMTRLSNNGNGTKIGSLDLPQHNFNKIFVLRLICSRRARLKRSNVSIKDRVTTLPAFKVISFGFTTSGHRCGACPPARVGGLGGLR